ncbi:MAG: S41 family peptidase [Bacteroidota bacterium]
MFPMLAALYHLLGDGTTYTVLNKEGKIKEKYILDKGFLPDPDSGGARIKPSQDPVPDIPVALITGKLSASSGELIALGFRGRKNTIIIGEKSYGLTSGNSLTVLPFDCKLTLTSGYLADREGTYTVQVIPDIEIIKEANLVDLKQDRNVQEGMKFISSKY